MVWLPLVQPTSVTPEHIKTMQDSIMDVIIHVICNTHTHTHTLKGVNSPLELTGGEKYAAHSL